MIKYCVEQKRIVALLCILLLCGGILAYMGLERQENPTITAPMAVITCVYPGASPEDVEKQVIKPMEKQVGMLDSVKTLESYAMDSVAVIKVTLKDMSDREIEDAQNEVKSKVSAASAELPSEVREPVIDTDMAQSYGIIIGLSAVDYTDQDLGDVARALQNRLKKIEGVAAVDLSGEVEQQVSVKLDMVKLNQYGISPSTIGTVMAARNVSIPGGNLEMSGAKVPVQISGEYENISEIRGTIVGVSKVTGFPVSLGNVAAVELESALPDITAQVNGEKAVLVGVRYGENQNVQAAGIRVRDELEQFRREELYRGMEMTVLTDQAAFVGDALSLFLSNLISAIILVVAVVWIFMGGRSAAVVSLPIALVTAVVLIFMRLLHIPMHQVSVASLIISLSLLVANGIVANDNIYLYLENGKDRLTASVDGVKNVNIPILTSTLTTIASFLPLAMMQGSAGKFAASLPVLVSVALLASYFMALTVVPALGNRILQVKESKHSRLEKLAERWKLKLLLARLKKRYDQALDRSLAAPKKTILLFTALLLLCLLLVPSLGIQVFPPIERDQYALTMTLPGSSTLDHTEDAARIAGQILAEEKSVENYACQVGGGFMKYYVTFMGATQGSNTAEFLVNGDRSQAESVAQEIGRAVPDASVHVKFLEINMPQEYPVELRISGSDLQDLRRAAEEVRSKVNGIPGSWSTEINYGYDSYKLKADVNEEKANLVGITNYDVASTIRMAVNGVETAQMKQEDIEKASVPVVMKLNQEQGSGVDSLRQIFFTSQITGENIPLPQIVELKTEAGSNKIVRRDEERTITIGLFLNSDSSSQQVLKECRKALEDYEPPQGCTLTYGGQNEFTDETFNSMRLPAVMAVVLIYLIMVFQFGNLLEPLIIMATIPLSFIGVIAGLRIMNYPVGFMALLGAISLMGVVVNNGIVLLDYIKQRRSLGEPLGEAVREACRVRMRPILIGMLTTVISLLPLMLSGGTLWAPLAAAIVFGMLVSTVLTLIVIPCAYVSLEMYR